MVGRVVYRVDTNRVNTKLLELGDISITNVGISKRVDVSGRTTRLIVNASNIESFVAGPERYRLQSASIISIKGRIGAIPLPDAVTVGKESARFGSSGSVGVGPAWTIPAAAKADARTNERIMMLL